MTRPGRTARDGHVVPWIVDWDAGRKVAQELGLDPSQIHGQDLATLGQAVNETNEAQTQDQDQDQDQAQRLAQALDRILGPAGHWLGPMPDEWKWRNHVAAHEGHHHARNETCTEPGPEPAPEPSTTVSPEVPSMVDSGPMGMARSSQRRMPRDRNDVLNEKNDPDEEMWK